MISRFVSAGNKVDVKIRIKNPQYMKGSNLPQYIDLQLQSSIYDITDDESLLLYMPTEQGKVRILPIGCMMELYIYTDGNLYRCDAVVKERFRADNIVLMKAELKSQLAKYQRRDYYRLDCLLEAKACVLPEEIYESNEDADAMLDELQQQNAVDLFKILIVDISGGGCRTRTDEKIEEPYLLLEIPLESRTIDTDVLLVLKRIDSFKNEINQDKYDTRFSFEKISKADREMIIKYIFEKEQVARKEKR